MTRDPYPFLSASSKVESQQYMTPLQKLGWHPFFAQQTSTDELAEKPAVRVVEVHRSGLHILGDGIDMQIPPREDATVGDWLLLDQNHPHDSAVLDRKSLIKRRAAGTARLVQLIAANIDTAFIVSSCNQDFNIARLERYIALVLESQIAPVIVLTKADLVDTDREFVEAAQQLSHLATLITLDARGREPETKLASWCKPGQTVAFLGSSGVGKSTLTNALSGTKSIETQPIREDDAKGRHTTTRRQLHLVPNGSLVLDTPGMRELQLTDAADGIKEVFSDIDELATSCRFKDCAHESEPGCAIRSAVEDGVLDDARFARWRKLVAEEAFNSASMAERRAKDKAFGKMVRGVIKQKTKRQWPRE